MDKGNKNKSAERIFAESTCLSMDVIRRYVEGTLNPEEKHAAERHLVDCELCSDAVEGFMEGSVSENMATADSLVKNIKILADPAPRQHSQIWIRQAIAAGVAILILAGASFFLIGRFSGPDVQIAAQEIPIEETLKPGQEIFKFGTELESKYEADEPLEMEKLDEEISEELSEEVSNVAPSILELKPEPKRTPLTSTGDRKISLKKNKQGRIVMEDEFFHIKEVSADDKPKSTQESVKVPDAVGASTESLARMAVAALPTEFERAMQNYNNGNYSASGRGFKKVLEQEPNNSDALYYGGISYLNTNKAGKAINNFDKITRNRSDKHYEDARWEKARALLKKGRIEEAKRLLNAIVYSNGKHRALAQKALEDMN